MKITINGKEESTQYNHSQLGNLLDQITAENNEEGHYLLKVYVDGQEVDFESPKAREIALDAVESLNIEYGTLDSIVERNIDNAEAYLEKFVPGLEKASDLYRTGNSQEASKFFLNIIDGIDWLSMVIDSVIEAKRLDIHKKAYTNQSLQERKEQLLQLTNQALEANKNKDWVLLADLLEYEILPFYQNWAEILPEIKNEKTNSVH